VRSGGGANWILIAMASGHGPGGAACAEPMGAEGLLGVNVVLAGFFAHLLYVATTVPARRVPPAVRWPPHSS